MTPETVKVAKSLEIQMAITNMKATVREWGETKSQDDWTKVCQAMDLIVHSTISTMPPRVELKEVPIKDVVKAYTPGELREVRVEVPVKVEVPVEVLREVIVEVPKIVEVRVPEYVYVPSAAELPEAVAAAADEAAKG